MRNADIYLRRATKLIPKLADTLASFGGHLECTNCGRVEALGDVRSHLSGGWPVCCRYTMRWVTARELALREQGKGEP